MKQHIFSGCGTALITPFTENGMDVDKKAFKKILDFQIDNGADALIVAGTTGESPVLSADEKQLLFRMAVEESGKKIPVIAGTGSNNTEEAVRKSNAAEKEGVAGLLIVTPYYNKCTQNGIIDHYFYIADRVSTPIIVYNVPSRTGVNIAPETYLKLSEHKNIVGVKEADGDISKFLKTLSMCGSSLDFYSGNDDLTGAMMTFGAKGVISVVSNVIPYQMSCMCREFLNGNYAQGAKKNIEYIKLMNALFCEVNPIPVKSAVNLILGTNPKPRLPLSEPTAKSLNLIKEALSEFI